MLQVYHQALFGFATLMVGGDSWAASYLVLLLKAVALCALHLSDVLEEVRHADRRVQLTRLIRHVDGLPFPQGVSVRLDQAACVAAHVLTLICGTQRDREAGAGQQEETGAKVTSQVINLSL